MRLVAQTETMVYVTQLIRIVDVDGSEVNPTIVSEQYPYVEYRDLMDIRCTALLHNSDPRVLPLLAETDNKLHYEITAGAGLHPDELDIVRAVRGMMMTDDGTGNMQKRTFGEFVDAIGKIGIEFVDSLEQEVVGSGK